jgi:CDGSH-type Zn-finger protein
MKVKVIKSGPYLVTGGIPLREKIIKPAGHGYRLVEGRVLPQSETYSLCRCGRSKNAPFCDGTHSKVNFTGHETASRDTYAERAELMEGHSIDLADDGRCAFFRFCHTNEGDVWSLTQDSYDDATRELAVKTAGECLAGRLVAVSKEGEQLEPKLEPEIFIMQDPERGVSSSIVLTGSIPVESQDGFEYEVRNRAALCRCGKSGNTPFCDASHVSYVYRDK